MNKVFTLAPEAKSVAYARLMVRRFFGADSETLELLVSEVVTNAVVHGKGPVVLTLGRSRDELRVEVSDASAATPVRREVDLDDTSGRGVMLVEALSDEWGVRAEPNGKTVWFTVKREVVAKPQFFTPGVPAAPLTCG